MWYQCITKDCDNRPFKVSQSDLDDAEGVINCEICDSPTVSVTISLTVAELRELLAEYNENVEVYCKPSIAIGTQGAIRKIQLETTHVFWEEKTVLLLTW